MEIKNFKKHYSTTIPLDKNILIISGPNGAGKTQILYSIILFVTAYNQYLHHSKPIPMSLIFMADKLFHPSFKHTTDYKHFIRGVDVEK